MRVNCFRNETQVLSQGPSRLEAMVYFLVCAWRRAGGVLMETHAVLYSSRWLLTSQSQHCRHGAICVSGVLPGGQTAFREWWVPALLRQIFHPLALLHATSKTNLPLIHWTSWVNQNVARSGSATTVCARKSLETLASQRARVSTAAPHTHTHTHTQGAAMVRA